MSLVSVYRLIEKPSVSPGPVFWLYDIDDDALTPLPDLEIDGHVATPATHAVLSPDGSAALIVYRSGELGHLVVLDLATSDAQVLEHPALDPGGMDSGWATNDTVLIWNSDALSVIHLKRRDATPAPAATP